MEKIVRRTIRSADRKRSLLAASASLVLALGLSTVPGQAAASQTPSAAATARNTLAPNVAIDMVAAILGLTEEYWQKQIQANEQNSPGLAQYAQPILTVSTQPLETTCGDSRKFRGLFYCAADNRIYFDVPTVSLLVLHEDAVADFAVAYIIAHEVSHSIQSSVLPAGKRGLFDALDEGRKTTATLKTLTQEYELQADCLAGTWAKYASDYDVLDPGDLDEALSLAGRGTASDSSLGELRVRYFRSGFASGRPADCDVFPIIREAEAKLGISLAAAFAVEPVLVTGLGRR